MVLAAAGAPLAVRVEFAAALVVEGLTLEDANMALIAVLVWMVVEAKMMVEDALIALVAVIVLAEVVVECIKVAVVLLAVVVKV